MDATATPPAREQALARVAVRASVARHAPRTPNPLRPSDEVLLAGMKVYRNNCAGCHGGPRRPSEWGSTDFYPRVPQFARTPPRKPDWQLYWIVARGVRIYLPPSPTCSRVCPVRCAAPRLCSASPTTRARPFSGARRRLHR